MKRLLLIPLFLVNTTYSYSFDHVNLSALYKVLDATIDSSAYFQKQKADAIQQLKDQYADAPTYQKRYDMAYRLYEAYMAYENDSALTYIQRCMDIAEHMGRNDLKAKSELKLACQLVDSGFYSEAEYHFKAVPKEFLKDELLITYLSGRDHLYGEMGYYSHDYLLKQRYYARSHEICDSLLTLLPPESNDYIALISKILNNKRRPDDALPYNDKWLRQVKPNTRDYAIMAFYRSEIYKRKGDVEMQRYWLIQSALNDIRLAINDQSALWNLANSLVHEEGNYDRAYRYIDFSWGCISKFSPHMRSWLVSPILTHINDQHKAELNATNNRLIWALILISILAVGILLMSFKLSIINSTLKDVNKRLKDSNRVKDEYITKFLKLCSEYIDKLDNYRIKVNRKLKANQFDDLKLMTGSTQMKEDEVKELFENFDTVFLNLFPNFVSEFNALLKPEGQITPPDGKHLTTDLRIFALIRLGIDESSRIAEFLRYSPNSIYNYRCRIKNKAIGDRDTFERRVKEIGINE